MSVDALRGNRLGSEATDKAAAGSSISLLGLRQGQA